MSKKQKPPLEKHITADIRRFLKYIGFFHWKQWQGLGSVKGVPDIVGIKTFTIKELQALGMEKIGVFVGIEVKTAKGKLSEHQDMFLRNIVDAGGIAIVARCVDDVVELKKGECKLGE